MLLSSLLGFNPAFDFRTIAIVVAFTTAFVIAYRAILRIIITPLRFRAHYAAQGVPGSARFIPIFGDLLTLAKLRNEVNPFAAQRAYWDKLDGRRRGAFFHFAGPSLSLEITDPDWMQEVRHNSKMRFGVSYPCLYVGMHGSDDTPSQCLVAQASAFHKVPVLKDILTPVYGTTCVDSSCFDKK